MKAIQIFAALLLSANFSLAQKAGAEMKFQRLDHDFGTIVQGGNGLTEFHFTNAGTQPLVISEAAVTCGCTTPSYPKHAMAPGEKGTIQVQYDTKRIGEFNKSVTIKSNAENGPIVLKIKGNVVAVETDNVLEKAQPMVLPKTDK